jgi:hypothetical protein
LCEQGGDGGAARVVVIEIEIERLLFRRERHDPENFIVEFLALRGKKWVKARASCQFNLIKSRIFEVFTGLETCHVLRHEKAA